jgi:hypothetical protein
MSVRFLLSMYLAVVALPCAADRHAEYLLCGWWQGHVVQKHAVPRRL